MASANGHFRWLKPREIRWLIYLAVLLAVAAWRYLPRPWHPALTVQTSHYQIYSSATPRQTDDTARALELLYTAYASRLGNLKTWRPPAGPFQVKLYRDRDEMRRINPGLGWAEAFYAEPFCRAYYSGAEINPYHWMMHECTHQLNHEAAHLRLAQWLEEGVAEYFSTSQIRSNGLALGCVDLNTYPVWWLDDLASTPDLARNLTNGSVIPLRAIVSGHGGPGLSQKFNLYYLHWWTLTYFIFETPKYRDRALPLLASGGGLDAFEKLIGPVDQVQTEWHESVRRLKHDLFEQNCREVKSKNIPRPFNAPPPAENHPEAK